MGGHIRLFCLKFPAERPGKAFSELGCAFTMSASARPVESIARNRPLLKAAARRLCRASIFIRICTQQCRRV